MGARHVNYRHAFHAGNFADCVKHALLVWLIRALQRKPGGISVLDTHAGAGAYDLGAAPALRTGEWRDGIARLSAAPAPALADYLNLVEQIGRYPGSPALARAMLRPQDRLVCCELHPEDYAILRARLAGDARVAVHRRDAWEALGALLPPPERRGLVLIDPPYEAPDEFDRLCAGLRHAHRRFANGVLVAWYPIKHRAPARALHARLGESGMRDIIAAELVLREPLDAARLNGCGLIVVNPPYRFAEEAPPILDALLERLGAREAGEAASLTRLAAE
jgi:23S rRNA (adenine2030-N6)-methyltransferase